MSALIMLGLSVLVLVGVAVTVWRQEVRRDRVLADRFNAAVDKILREE